MVKAIINTTGINRVSVNKTDQTIARTVTLNPQVLSSNFLRSLNDVDSSSLSDNDTIVYDATSDKFVTRNLPFIDGGTF